MAFSLNLRQVGDYIILPGGVNVVPGRPKSGWTPAVGQLVKRETAADNEFDLCAATENPQGIVVTTNGATHPAGIALFADGVTVILPTSGAIALNDKVRCTATGLADVGTANFQRSEVEAAAGGVGTVIDLEPYGTDTATVAFEAVKP